VSVGVSRGALRGTRLALRGAKRQRTHVAVVLQRLRMLPQQKARSSAPVVRLDVGGVQQDAALRVRQRSAAVLQRQVGCGAVGVQDGARLSLQRRRVQRHRTRKVLPCGPAARSLSARQASLMAAACARRGCQLCRRWPGGRRRCIARRPRRAGRGTAEAGSRRRVGHPPPNASLASFFSSSLFFASAS